ncbi:MAG TPA: hypothetical protein VEI82_14470, partial [Myxococcota bacterium]|nr:hypothetical protein [Myxococcota bacterium]
MWAAAAGLALADEPNAPKADEQKKADEGFWSGLPLWKDKAIAAGAELPLPFGAALVMTGLKGRDITVTDLRLGLNGNQHSVSRFVNLGSTSDVVNANLKLDLWLLPFLNLYTLLGYVHNESTTHALVTVPRPGPIPGTRTVAANLPTVLDGFIGGLGATLAGGYKQLFAVADCNYDQIDMGFDDTFHALIASGRAGWNGRIREVPTQFWVGAGYWNTAATAKGHTDIAGVGRFEFEADQRPVRYWMYDLGGQFSFSKQFQLFIDVGTDFAGGYVFAAGPTLRF